VNDKTEKAFVKSLTKNSKSLTLTFQLCGEAESCSIEIPAEDVIQGNILLLARQNRLVSKKNWWRTLCRYKSYDEKNGYLLLLQLSKEVSGDPLQLQEILRDFFRLSSRYKQRESSDKFNGQFLDHEEALKSLKGQLKQQEVESTDFQDFLRKAPNTISFERSRSKRISA
jgi:hypothetical protein